MADRVLLLLPHLGEGAALARGLEHRVVAMAMRAAGRPDDLALGEVLEADVVHVEETLVLLGVVAEEAHHVHLLALLLLVTLLAGEVPDARLLGQLLEDLLGHLARPVGLSGLDVERGQRVVPGESALQGDGTGLGVERVVPLGVPGPELLEQGAGQVPRLQDRFEIPLGEGLELGQLAGGLLLELLGGGRLDGPLPRGRLWPWPGARALAGGTLVVDGDGKPFKDALIMFALVVTQVALRYGFNESIGGANELATILFAYTQAAGAPMYIFLLLIMVLLATTELGVARAGSRSARRSAA